MDKLNSRPRLLIIGLLFLAFLAIFLLKKIADSQPTFLGNCSQAKARHLTNIPKGSVYYREALDRNKNGIACET